MLLSVVFCSLFVAFAAADGPSEADINYDKNAILAEVVDFLSALKPYAQEYKAAFGVMAAALEERDFNATKVELGEVRNLASRLEYEVPLGQMQSVQDEFRRLSSRSDRRVREAEDDIERLDEFIEKLDTEWDDCSAAIDDPRPQGCYLNVDGSSVGVYIDQGSNVCVKFDQNEVNWATARAFCQDLGMDLATVDTQSKHDFIYSKFQNELSGPDDFYYWIGGLRGADNSFYWVSNDQPFSSGFRAWHSGEPNNAGSEDENCVHIWGQGNTWNDAVCSRVRNVVCHGELGFTPSI